MISIKKTASLLLLSLVLSTPYIAQADDYSPSSPVQQKIVTPEQAQANIDKANSGNKNHGTVKFDFWTGQEPQLAYADFSKEINNGQVKEVIFSADIMENLQAKVLLKNGERYNVFLVARNSDNFMKSLQDKGVQVNVVKDFSSLNSQRFTGANGATPSTKDKVIYILGKIWSVVSTLLYMLLYIVVFIVIMLWVQKKMMGFSGNRYKKINPKDIDVSFSDIAGNEEAKRDIMEVVEFLKNKDKYDKLGARLPRGILLSGDPGNGKTMFAKAIAKESGAAFFQCSGSEFDEVFVGLGASRVRDLFKKARKAKKAVIFIDEIDAVGKARGSSLNSGSEQTLNQLLTAMDGFDSSKYEIVVVAATNRIDVLDEALLRPGRFDRKIIINKPSEQGRFDILNVYLNKVKKNKGRVSNNVDVRKIARITVGFSGAELANLVNEALIRAAKSGTNVLTHEHLIKARTKIMLGDPRVDINMIEKEKELTAYHEAGHAVVALAVSNDPVEQVTITPHGMALGLMLQVPEREAWMITEDDLNGKIQVLMGGRASEEVFLKRCSTGASNDMERAYEIAMNMSVRWGMGTTLSTISVKDINTLSPITRAAVDNEVIANVKCNYEKSKEILKSNEKVIQEMVKVLLEKETLEKHEIIELWKEHGVPLSISI